MFNKFIKIKNIISNALTSLESQQPKLPYDPTLNHKLHFYTNYILSH